MITIPRTSLLPLIASANTMAGTGPIEATRYAFLSHEGGKLRIKATDSVNWLAMEVECEGALEPIQVDAGKLQAVTAKMRGDMFRLSTADGKLKIASKKGGSRTVSGVFMPYPQPPAVEGEKLVLDSAKLREAIAFTRESASTDIHAKPHLCGMHIHHSRGRLMAASAYAAGVSAIELAAGEGELAFTIASDTVKHLSLITAPTVTLTVSDRAVQFDWEGGSMRGQRIDKAFVDYERSIPTYETYLAIRANELLECMNAIAPVATEDFSSGSQIMRLRLGDEGVMLQGVGDNEQPVDAEWHGPPLVLGFISKRMKAALDGFGDDELRIEIGGGEMPIAVRSAVRGDRVSVLMPVRC